MNWHMLHFSGIQCKPLPEQLFSFADAYLESAETLCEKLCTDGDHATYAHGAVVMSLTFHSLELFIKGAILLKVPTEQFGGRSGHDLDHLMKRYKKLYPGKNLGFDVPFRRHLPETEGMDPRVAEELVSYVRKQSQDMPEDQLHRYPASLQGETWNAVLGFEPNSFLFTIQGIKKDLSKVKSLLQGG